MVWKKNSGWRPCCDYRRLNKLTVPDRYPIPLITDAQTILKVVYLVLLICHREHGEVHARLIHCDFPRSHSGLRGSVPSLRWSTPCSPPPSWHEMADGHGKFVSPFSASTTALCTPPHGFPGYYKAGAQGHRGEEEGRHPPQEQHCQHHTPGPPIHIQC